MMLLRRYVAIFIMVVASSAPAWTQGFTSPSTPTFSEPVDTLIRKSEWWLGVHGSAFYSMNFGVLTTNITGGTAPGELPFQITPEGGWGYGIGLGPALEYRPIFSDLGFLLTTNLDYRIQWAQTTDPIKYDILAVNATFEARSIVLYSASTLSAKMQLGVTGAFIMAGLTFDMPLTTIDSYVWQHEVWEGEDVTNEPGHPQTSIKFDNEVQFRPRVGLQFGVGHDFMVGMFGYRGQLITPYATIQAGTPSVWEPTMWNNISLRIGAIWRAGL
jgi:hypothetical protein